MIRYAITAGEEDVTAAVARWSSLGVDIVQLRDKALDSGELAAKARVLLNALRTSKIRLLINGRVDVALATGAAGVHLTSQPDELTPDQVRKLVPDAIISVSCHTLAEVSQARNGRVDWILFGPVFEKRIAGELVTPGSGLEALREAANLEPEKVLALGGVTEARAPDCLQAGACGYASIRAFS